MREGWKEVTLGSVLKKIIGGGTPSKMNSSYWNGNIFWCSVKDMSENSPKLYSTEDTITLEGLKSSASNLLPKGTVITSTRMGLGKAFINGVDMAINQDLKALIPNDEIDNDFLLYTILVNRNILEGLGTGATVKGIKLETLKAIKISLPSLKIQRKIASILSGYDDLIENNQKRIKLLEKMAQQTYEEWFVRMRFPGYETAVFDENGLPEGWAKVKLGQLWEIQSSKRIYLSDYVESGVPFFRGKEISQKGGNLKISDVLYISELKFSELKNKFGAPKAGDILLTAVGTLGNLYMVKHTDDEFYFKDGNLIWLKENSKYSSHFLFYTLKSSSFQNHINNIAIGSSQKALTIKGLKESEIIYPSKDIIEKLDEIVKPINLSIENLQSQNQRFREVRDILLPRLMMGMIDVSGSLVQMESIEAKPTDAKVIPLEQPKKEASKEFKEAVLIACLTERFGSKKFPLGRKRYTKLSYLFHRYSDNKIQDYLRKAAGPYNPKTKYGGPEKIALQNKYIQNWKGEKGTTGFVTAEKIEDAKTYFSNYWQIADLDWLTTAFKFKSNDELELLATVDNSLVELSKKNLEFIAANVLGIIKSEKEWEAKLERTIFSDANVERAIGFLRGVLEYEK